MSTEMNSQRRSTEKGAEPQPIVHSLVQVWAGSFLVNLTQAIVVRERGSLG